MLPSYLFPGDKQQLDLSNSMMSYWSEFAYHGNPGKGRSGNETSWQRWGDEGQYSLLLDTNADQGIRMNDEAVTLASLKQELKDDTGFEDPIAHCRTYVRNFRNETFNQSEYEALNSECAKHEPESLNQG
jgi:para-nitrobenzyl esterase